MEFLRRRREFITLVGGAAVAWPLAARAQGPTIPVIGFLRSTSLAVSMPMVTGFRQGLTAAGFTEGQNVAIEYRYADNQRERLPGLVAELIRLPVAVIVANNIAALSAKAATTTVPIVFATGGDPVVDGLVAGLNRPGGNVTGLSSRTGDLAGKRLELLRELIPGLRRLAIMVNVDAPAAVLEVADVQTTAHALGLEVVRSEIRRAKDIAPALEALKGRADALLVPPEPLVFANRIRINILAASARLPTMYGSRDYVEGGGLMAYGPNFPDQFRRAGDYVDRILRGVKPGEIPVEQPSKFDLVINLTTAKALGLTIPESFLLRADEVIE